MGGWEGRETKRYWDKVESTGPALNNKERRKSQKLPQGLSDTRSMCPAAALTQDDRWL